MAEEVNSYYSTAVSNSCYCYY